MKYFHLNARITQRLSKYFVYDDTLGRPHLFRMAPSKTGNVELQAIVFQDTFAVTYYELKDSTGTAETRHSKSLPRKVGFR